MNCYKYLLGFAFLLFLVSCRHQSKEILKFVNDQNDGWNAFSITLRDNNTYKREDFGSSYTGKYHISGTTISLGKNEIVFDTTSSGCIYNARYGKEESLTDMRVVFDNLFCKPLPRERLIGKWVYETVSSGWDTLLLPKNGTATFGDSDYEKWNFEDPIIFLTNSNTSTQLLVRKLQADSLWFRVSWSGDTDRYIKAVRLK
jgi:hypothetical protein